MTNQGKDMEDNDLDSNDRFKMTVEELKQIRNEVFIMTQKEMSELLGVDYETVSSWELRRNPIPSPISMLIRILVEIQGTEYGEKYGLD